MKTSYRSDHLRIDFTLRPRQTVTHEKRQWPKPDKFFGSGMGAINSALEAHSVEEAEEVLLGEYKVHAPGIERYFDGMVSWFDLTWRITDISELWVDEQGNFGPPPVQ